MELLLEFHAVKINGDMGGQATVYLSEHDMEKFLKADAFLKEHFPDCLTTHVSVDFDGMEFEEKFHFDVELSFARIFKDEVYFYAQESHGSNLQWESKGVRLDFLKEIMAGEQNEVNLEEELI
jgi:hypothetical protein